MKQLTSILAAILVLAACTPGEDAPDSQELTVSRPAGQSPASGNPVPDGIRQTYLRTCHSCHEAGVTGAPRTGDVAAWKPRAAKGLNMLVANAMNGYRAMPPKGLCFDCTEAEFAGLIRYMAGDALDGVANGEETAGAGSAGD
ncbi:c-type cytochrome [Microbulbifer sediminum]|uniref:c-type cytochrome n=1 Tax=Microbulbifer sediminum TaxID=2904250 RepID=UPI001F02E93C|nr:c-type cytochrome [Microbulbifer sediminum]